MDTPYVEIPLGVVRSTQEEAMQRFAGMPALVTATRQTAGRGRSGAAWEHADRAVAASLAFRTHWPEPARPRLALVAGLAAAGAVGGAVRLKWPNDLVLDGLKVGGLLVEADGDLIVAGLGVNLFWRQPIEGAGAVGAADPGPEAALRVARVWAKGLLRRAAGDPAAWGRREYAALCTTIGSVVQWSGGGHGRATGVAADGGLEVATADGEVVLRAGEVREIRPAGGERLQGGGARY
jgi:BirA family biotin operon repressor/biotin-[acetyl-CoA-carboxylase] ligase